MKKNTLLKVLIILVILAICLISFVGVFTKNKNSMVSVLPDYILSMNLNDSREVSLKVSEDTNTVTYDAEGNVTQDGLDEEGNLKEGYTTQEEKVNKDESLTQENYQLSKGIMEKRLENMGATDYTVRQEPYAGKITVKLPNSTDADDFIANLAYKGKFEIIDSETNEVLINNAQVKESKAVYSTGTYGTAVYLSIEFNKEGKQKLEEITTKYVSSSDEEGNDTTKKVSIKLDDEQLLETYFDEVNKTGTMQLSIGSQSTDSEKISGYIKQATLLASLITNKPMELKYEIENDVVYTSVIEDNQVAGIIICTLVFVCIGIIYLIAKFKIKGCLAVISYIGYIGVLLLSVRFTNVIISPDGIIGFIVALITNFVFINYILKKISSEDKTIKQIMKEAFVKCAWVVLPLLIISICFTFMNWTAISSLGMVMFWGIVSLVITNILFTRTLLDE